MKIKDMQQKPELYTTFFQDNAGELESRMNQLRLANSWKNGQVIVEFMLAGNLEVTIENVLSVVDSNYKDQLQFLPDQPTQARPAKMDLHLTRKQATQLTPIQIKELVNNSKLGTKEEIWTELNRILALPAETPESESAHANELAAYGIERRRGHGHSVEAPTGPTDEQRKSQNLVLRRAEYDEAVRKIRSIVVQAPFSGKTNYAQTENKQREELSKLGERP